MTCEGFIARNLTFGLGMLFAVTAILLLYTNSQRNELSRDVIALRKHVKELNDVVLQLKAELEGPDGCKEQVGVVTLWVMVKFDHRFPLGRSRANRAYGTGVMVLVFRMCMMVSAHYIQGPL